MMKRSFGDLFVNRKKYLIKLFDNEKKNEKEIARIKEEVDFDLERVCNINKYYKQVNETLIILSDISEMIEEKYAKKTYFDDANNPEVEVWEWILVVS
jgi:hypothetical protein